MSLAVERFDARSWAGGELDPLFDGAFPAYITADQVAKAYISRVREWFADLNIILVDDNQVPVATGWAVPIRWNGQLAGLPTGYTDTLRRAVDGHEADQPPDTLVICGAIVRPGKTGQGLAAQLLTALRGLAPQAGCPRILAPVRPTLKPAYPLIPIEIFARWTRPDGAPLDPWLRTHHRIGGTIIAMAPRSQTMTGTVAEWEAWTGMALPATGDYVIPGGLSILHIDTSADLGTYTEPNVWVRHS